MSKQRQKIEAAAKRLGIALASIEWEPIGPACEFEGNSGGWTVHSSKGQYFGGYNVDEVVEDMENSVRFGWDQRQFELGRRSGIHDAAKEKDAEINRLRELVAALSFPRGVFAPAEATQIINRIKRDTLQAFVRKVWTHVPYAQSKSGIHEPVPAYGWAIQDIMTATFGKDWNNDLAFEPPSDPVEVRQSEGPFNVRPGYMRCRDCDRLATGEAGGLL